MNTENTVNAEVETISSLGIEHTWQEVLALAEAYSHHSGLDKEQIAVNSIGFPFIPIPEVRQSGSRIRLAPRNVTADFIGHPIFWIDPALTARREGESKERWSVRMFYVIMSFGYWDAETLNWIDFLNVHDMDSWSASLADSPYLSYHSTAFVECFADDPEFALMGEKDYLLDEDGNSIAEATMSEAAAVDAIISDIEVRTQDEFAAKMKQNITTVAVAIGGDPAVVNDPSKGFWNLFEEQIDYDLDQYKEAAEDLSISRVSIEKDIIESAQAMMAEIAGLNEAAATLTLPVLKSMGMSMIEANSFMNFMRQENGEKVVAERYNYPALLLERFEAIDADGVFKVFQRIYTEYVEVWKRARLAYINFSLQPEAKAGRADFFFSYEELSAAYDEENELRYEDVNRYIEDDGSADDVSRLDEYIGDMGVSSYEEMIEEPVVGSNNQELDDLLGELDNYSGYSKPEVGKYEIELD